MWWVIGVGMMAILFIVGAVWLAIRPFMPSDEEIASDLSGKMGERAAEDWLRSRS